MERTLDEQEAPRLPKVVIVGGGLVGVLSAYYLQRSGCQVTVLEKRDSICLETSFANAGRFCPSSLAGGPIARPEVVKSVMNMLWSSVVPSGNGQADDKASTSNLYEEKEEETPVEGQADAQAGKIQLSLPLIQWGIHFLMNCSRSRFEKNLKTCEELAALSMDVTEEVLSDVCQDSDSVRSLHRAGKTDLIFDSGESFLKALHKFRSIPSSLISWTPHLGPEQVVAASPWFSNDDGRWTSNNNRVEGGTKEVSKDIIPTPQASVTVMTDWSADARQFALAVMKRTQLPRTVSMEAEGSSTQNSTITVPGVRYCLGSQVVSADLDQSTRAIRSLKTRNGATYEADAVVFACGPQTERALTTVIAPRLPFLHKLRLTVPPITPMRGVSFELEDCSGQVPLVALADYRSGPLNYQITPLPSPDEEGRVSRLRIVGFADFVSPQSCVRPSGVIPPPHAVEQLVHYTRRLFPNLKWKAESPLWCALRPMTPDNLPIVGSLTPLTNAFVNCGHGSMGWTTSPATGYLLSRACMQTLQPLVGGKTRIQPKEPELHQLSQLHGGASPSDCMRAVDDLLNKLSLERFRYLP